MKLKKLIIYSYDIKLKKKYYIYFIKNVILIGL